MGCLSDYAFGHVRVGDRTIRRDLIVCGEEILSPWNRREGHRLSIEDLGWILERDPTVIIVGTGAIGRLVVPHETSEALLRKGIQLVSFKTAAALAEYNSRAATGERVAACLHLTC